MYPGPGASHKASASVAREGGASAVPRYKTGLDSALCPGLSLCWRPSGQQEVLVTERKVGRCLSNDPGGERQLEAVPLEESKSTQKTESCSVVSGSLQPRGLYSPWNSPGQNTGVGSCSLLQGIFPTQGSNPGLPHCRDILYQLSHKGSPNLSVVLIGNNFQ